MVSVMATTEKPTPNKNNEFLWYYIKNIWWGILTFFAMTYSWNSYDYKISSNHPLYIPVFFSSLLFPFAKHAIETFALKFTTRQYWHKGYWVDTPGKTGVIALFYLMCIVVAIPIGLPYAIYKFYVWVKH